MHDGIVMDENKVKVLIYRLENPVEAKDERFADDVFYDGGIRNCLIDMKCLSVHIKARYQGTVLYDGGDL